MLWRGDEPLETVQDTKESSRLVQFLLRLLSFTSWTILVIVAVAIGLLVLLPYWGTGGHFPSTPPGTIPDRPDEFYSISLFRGTIWEDKFWSDLFWNMACSYPTLCLWLPAFLYSSVEILVRWNHFSRRGKYARLVAMVVLILFGILWFNASLVLLGVIMD